MHNIIADFVFGKSWALGDFSRTRNAIMRTACPSFRPMDISTHRWKCDFDVKTRHCSFRHLPTITWHAHNLKCYFTGLSWHAGEGVRHGLPCKHAQVPSTKLTWGQRWKKTFGGKTLPHRHSQRELGGTSDRHEPLNFHPLRPSKVQVAHHQRKQQKGVFVRGLHLLSTGIWR